MRKIFSLLSLLLLFGTSSVNAQIALLYTDTSLYPGNTITLGVHQPPVVISDVTDDSFSDTISIGFSFVYFGNSYVQYVSSTNNFISFDTALAHSGSHYIYNTAKTNGQLNNAILFPFQDLFAIYTGKTSYALIGSPHHQKLVIEVCKTPLYGYGCDSFFNTDQLILNEGSNNIEMYIGVKTPNCDLFSPNWNTGSVQGLRKDSVEFFVPGRDLPLVEWTAFEDGKQFTPVNSNTYTIASVPYTPWHSLDSSGIAQIRWYDENNTLLGQGASVNVTPGINTHYYTARYTGPAGCDTNTYSFIDTVHVQVTDTTTPPPPTGINGGAFLEKGIFVYPNPASNVVTIESKNGIAIKSINLFAPMGNAVKTRTIFDNRNKHVMSLQDLNTGIYILQIETDKGIIRRKIEVLKP